MAPNGGDHLRLTTARASPVVRRPPPREIPTAPNRVINLTEENQSLFYSLRYYTTLTPQESDTCMQSLINLMTSNEEDGAAQFNEVVSRLDVEGNDLRTIAMLLTSDLDRFMEIARNNNGSNRIQELLGITENTDTFFFNAILNRFVQVMTDHEASNVGRQGMRVFSDVKKAALHDNVLRHAVHLACDRSGNVVLKQIITEWSGWGDFLYRDWLLYIVALNALSLSRHVYGNHVVQHVLTLHDLGCTYNVAVSLNGHCFDLSFTKYGSYVVQKLLDTETAVTVVGELERCEGERLLELARNDYGNYVVVKALRVMRERNMDYLFWGLVNKLRPFADRLRGRNIGAFLYSLR